MRFIIIVKATADSEAGVMPGEALLSEMATYHEQLIQAGWTRPVCNPAAGAGESAMTVPDEP